MPAVRRGAGTRILGNSFLLAGIVAAVGLMVALLVGHHSSGSPHTVSPHAAVSPPRTYLDPPRALHIVQLSATELDLSWRPVGGAAYYAVFVASHRYRSDRAQLRVFIGLQPGARYTWSVEAVGRHGSGARSPAAVIDAQPLPTELWLFDAIPARGATVLLIYNPGRETGTVHVQTSPGAHASAAMARIPPANSLVVPVLRAPGAARLSGVLVTSTTPILAQRAEVVGNTASTFYGLPVVNVGGIPASSSSG
jgi:hypothetical protein